MTHTPDFDELVGLDLEPDERDRLQRVHALLIAAGPPAELSPELEAGPTLALTLSRKRRANRAYRRGLLLAAAICILALAFLGGYLAANGGSSSDWKTLSLAGTPSAPGALASLRIEPADSAGNWPMQLTVTGLPKLPAYAYYEVYLMRNGKPYAPCGTFVVDGRSRATSVSLNAPYRLTHGDTWIVTEKLRGKPEPGVTMMTPV
ncbi:MAG TPA: hypothetical protein VFM96_05505 [Gaiellaceae bacterium]|nr:hypothetical protein [Gaiellaceae bacterium]